MPDALHKLPKAFMWLALPLALLLASVLPAYADDKPAVGILRFGFYPTAYWMEGAILNHLELYGWIDAEEKSRLRQREDLENARISIFWGDADFDFNNAALLIDAALDREPDALITFSTPSDPDGGQPDSAAGCGRPP